MLAAKTNNNSIVYYFKTNKIIFLKTHVIIETLYAYAKASLLKICQWEIFVESLVALFLYPK